VIFFHRLGTIYAMAVKSKPAGERLQEMLQICRARMGVTRSVELRLSDSMDSPAVCGLVRPVIVMPGRLLEQMSRSKVTAVLMHELAHVKRGDLWVNFFQTILQIFYFYNPVSWLANAYIRRVREQAADEMVLTRLHGEAATYSDTLIDVAEMAFSRPRFNMAMVGVIESRNRLKERIRIMLNKPVPKDARIGLAGFVLLAAAAVVMLPMARAEEHAESSAEVRHGGGAPGRVEIAHTPEMPPVPHLESAVAPELAAKVNEGIKPIMEQVGAMLKAMAPLQQQIKIEKQNVEQLKAKNAPQSEIEAAEERLDKLGDQLDEIADKYGEQIDAAGDKFEAEFEPWVEQYAEQLAAKAISDPNGAVNMQKFGEEMAKFGQEMGAWETQFGASMGASIPHIAGGGGGAPGQEGSEFKKIQELAVPFPAGSVVIAKTAVGNISVTGTTESGCKVIATIHTKGATPEQAEEIAKKLEVEITQEQLEGGKLSAVVHTPTIDKSARERISIDLAITVPHDSVAHMKTDVGDITVLDVTGKLDCTTNVGKVTCEGTAGEVAVNANVGDVVVTYAADAPAACVAAVKTEVGQVHFTGPAKMSAKVAAKTQVGKINTELLLKIEGEQGQKANGVVGDGMGDVALKSEVGNITIGIGEKN
jgi:hypothetical protein